MHVMQCILGSIALYNHYSIVLTCVITKELCNKENDIWLALITVIRYDDGTGEGVK